MAPVNAHERAAPAGALQESSEHAISTLVQAAQDAEHAETFLRETLQVIAATFGSPYAVLEARHLSRTIEERVSRDQAHEAFWGNTVQGAITDAIGSSGPRARVYRAREGKGGLALLSAPVRGGGGALSGSLALVTTCASQRQAEDLVSTFGALISLVSVLLETAGSPRAPASTLNDGQASALRKSSKFASTTELAYTLTNKLRTREDLDLVALASVHGKRVQVLSISGLDEVLEKSPGVRDIKGAMEECLDLGCPVMHPAPSEDSEGKPARGKLHALWSQACGDAPVLSIPLRGEDDVVAILSIRFGKRSAVRLESIDEYRELFEPYMSTLGMLDRATRSLTSHAKDSLRSGWRRLIGWRHLGTKVKVLTPVTLLAWLMLGELDYEVAAPCTITPTRARHVSTPGDGTLAIVHALPGDLVEVDDVLCEFDTHELRLELTRLESQLAILGIEVDRALASGDPAELKLAEANKRETRTHMDLVAHQIDAARVRSPVAGIIAEGDLRERVGDVFQKGEPLYVVSADHGWTLELSVAEQDVSELRPGQIGRFSSMARPEDIYRIELDRVSPGARSENGENVFDVEAKVSVDDRWVRSGMEGIAKIEVGERRAGWVLFHSVVDWIRLRFLL